MRRSIFHNQVISQRVGNEGAQDAEDRASDKEGHGIRHDLMVDSGKAEIVPVEGREIGFAEDQRAGPEGCAEDRDKRPWIVDEGAGEECDEIQTEGPGTKGDHDGVKTVRRRERDEDADGECQGGSMRRFPQVQDLSKQRTHIGQGRHKTPAPVKTWFENARN